MEPCKYENVMPIVCETVKEIRLDTKKILQDIATLKAKSAFIGAIAGGIAGLIPILITLFIKG